MVERHPECTPVVLVHPVVGEVVRGRHRRGLDRGAQGVVMVEAPPGVDVTRVSGYNSRIPAGGETTASISLTGREPGEYMVAVEVLCHDVGGGTITASGAFPVIVESGVGLLLAAALGVIGVGAAAYILSKAGAKAEKLNNGEQKAGEAAEKSTKTSSEAAKKEEPQ